MRLTIRHETAYRYAKPARRVIETLRLTPRGHNGQFVVSWRIDVDKNVRLQRATDPFGNTLHSFTVDGPLDGLVIVASGSVETQDMNGVLSGQIERFPADIFLRETRLTSPDPAIRDFAAAVKANAGADPLGVMHALMANIGDRLVFDRGKTGPGTSASEAFGTGHGVCQDLAHIFIAAARHLNVPARYVSGYLYLPEAEHPEAAAHAWAEALIPKLGWVGFDPANVRSPTDAYVRVAVGLDALGAAPVRGAHYGGDGEALTVTVGVTNGEGRNGRARQAQRQSQS